MQGGEERHGRAAAIALDGCFYIDDFLKLDRIRSITIELVEGGLELRLGNAQTDGCCCGAELCKIHAAIPIGIRCMESLLQRCAMALLATYGHVELDCDFGSHALIRQRPAFASCVCVAHCREC